MANIRCVAEHSVDLDLLNEGICVDLGCRGFDFSKAMWDLGLRVFAFDLEEMVAPQGIVYFQMAVTDKRGEVFYVDTEDKQAKYLSNEGTKSVMGITIEDVYTMVGENIDVLKIDIEGSEWEVIMSMKYPVAKQITFEMHQHTSKKRTSEEVQSLFDHLKQWYELVYTNYSRQHGLPENYWDILFIRKDL